MAKTWPRGVGLLILLAGGACVLLWAGGLLFAAMNGIHAQACRPWTILQYWGMYAESPVRSLRLSVHAALFGPWIGAAALLLAALLMKKDRPLYGDARFASASEIRAAGLLEPKETDRTILVGQWGGKYLAYGGTQFVMLAAPTRSGKGVGIVVPNCLNFSDSLVVLDIKLENFERSAGFRAACGQKVFLFAPFDESGRTHRYNPLDYVSTDPAARMGDIESIATALYSGGGQSDRFWNENAKDLFRGLCLLVLETPDIPHTLGEILRQASGKGKSLSEHVGDLIEARSVEGKPFSAACVDCLNRILSNSENTLSGIVATFCTPLLIFQNPRVDAAMSASDFDLRAVRRERMTVYLGIRPNKLKDGAVIINLFFDQLLNQNCRTLPSEDPLLKYQCLLVMDEFTSIGRVPMVADAVSYMAGYNMRLLTVIQNQSQLEEVYGRAGAVTIKANHALMVMYAPSPVVLADAKEYSEMLGDQTVKGKSRSTPTGFGRTGGGSESVSDQRRPLMNPQEIRELGTAREIVSLENLKPILCRKIRYFEDPVFQKRAAVKPPGIPVVDVGIFLAKLEERTRPAAKADWEDPAFEEKVVGPDELAEAVAASYEEGGVPEEAVDRAMRKSFAGNYWSVDETK